MTFLAELKRRNVVRMAGLYLVGAWLTTQVAATVLPLFGAPGWMARSIIVVLGIGFVPALVVAWVFELTPDGLKRDAEVPAEQSIAPQTARRMERMFLLLLAIALGFFAFHVAGGLIHLLLIVGVNVLIWNFVVGRRAV
jgi:hypothetical protein